MMGALQILGAVILVALLAVLAFVPAHACCYRYLNLPAQALGLHLKEWHHGWLVVLALIPWVPVQVVALLLGLDDLSQHVQHLIPGREGVRSPLHHLARLTWYRWREEK